jgi:hypothetical protein
LDSLISNCENFLLFFIKKANVDEIISRIYFSFKDLQANPGKYRVPKWYNLYGAPKQDYSRKMNAMNKGYLEASVFRGRVLLSLEIVPGKDCKVVLLFYNIPY